MDVYCWLSLVIVVFLLKVFLSDMVRRIHVMRHQTWRVARSYGERERLFLFCCLITGVNKCSSSPIKYNTVTRECAIHSRDLLSPHYNPRYDVNSLDKGMASFRRVSRVTVPLYIIIFDWCDSIRREQFIHIVDYLVNTVSVQCRTVGNYGVSSANVADTNVTREKERRPVEEEWMNGKRTIEAWREGMRRPSCCDGLLPACRFVSRWEYVYTRV